MSRTDGTSRSIDGFSIFGLVVVVAAMVPVLFPINIPIGSRCTRVLRKVAITIKILAPPHSPSSQNNSHPSSKETVSEDSWNIVLDLYLSPLLGVLILLATTTIGGSVIEAGILGEGDIKPYDILVLFICLAYIAIALDSTGALCSLALFVANKSSRSGPQLYFILYCFFFLFGMIFGNDPIILSGTAFLSYFLRHCGITNPTAWIFMEFVACNVASAILVSSNPTNVLIAQAFNLNFLTGFTKFTILPSLIAALSGYILLYTIFKSLSVPDAHLLPSSSCNVEKDPLDTQATSLLCGLSTKLPPKLNLVWKKIPKANYIPEKLNPPKISSRSALVDLSGAVFHGALMLITLGALLGTSFVKQAAVWEVALPAGVLALLRDVIVDLNLLRRQSSDQTIELKALGSKAYDTDFQVTPSGTRNLQEVSPGLTRISPPSGLDAVPQSPWKRPGIDGQGLPCLPLALAGDTAQAGIEPLSTNRGSIGQGVVLFENLVDQKNTVSDPCRLDTFEGLLATIAKCFPTTSKTLRKLPFPLLPFAMSMFILVSSLGHLGWVPIFARCFATICTTPARTTFFVGFLGSLVLCPFLGTNIGATILLVNIISNEEFQMNNQIVKDNPKILQCAIFASALSSNLGAFSLTLSSSLAGLLWNDILKSKKIYVKPVDFLFWNICSILVLSLVSFCVVLLEMLYFF